MSLKNALNGYTTKNMNRVSKNLNSRTKKQAQRDTIKNQIRTINDKVTDKSTFGNIDGTAIILPEKIDFFSNPDYVALLKESQSISDSLDIDLEDIFNEPKFTPQQLKRLNKIDKELDEIRTSMSTTVKQKNKEENSSSLAFPDELEALNNKSSEIGRLKSSKRVEKAANKQLAINIREARSEEKDPISMTNFIEIQKRLARGGKMTPDGIKGGHAKRAGRVEHPKKTERIQNNAALQLESDRANYIENGLRKDKARQNRRSKFGAVYTEGVSYIIDDHTSEYQPLLINGKDIYRFSSIYIDKNGMTHQRYGEPETRDINHISNVESIVATRVDLVNDMIMIHEPEIIKFTENGVVRYLRSGLKCLQVSNPGENFKKVFSKLVEGFKGIKKFEIIFGPIINFIYQLVRSRNFFDIMSALYAFIKSVDISDSCVEYILTDIYESMKYRFEELMNNFIRDKPVQTESFSDNVQEVNNIIHLCFNSEIITAVRQIIINIAAIKWFNKDVAKSIFKFCGNPPATHMLGLFELMIDQMVTLIRFGESLVKGVPLSHLLIAKNPIKTVSAGIDDLMTFRDRLFMGLPQKDHMCYRQYLRQAEVLVKTAQALLVKASPTKNSTIDLKKKVNILIDHVIELTNQVNAGERPMPMGIILHGDPGIGKGKLIAFIVDIYCKCKGIEYDPDIIFAKILSSDYWENYRPLQQPVVRIPEMGNCTEAIAQQGNDKTLPILTGLMDTNAFPVDMAFGEKGKVFARPDLIIGDTNNKLMNMDAQIMNKAAIMRRMTYVEPVVKPRFRKEGATELDSAKSLASDVDIMDRWYFNICTYDAKGPKEVVEHKILSVENGHDIYDLVRVLTAVFMEHMQRQDEILAASSTMRCADYIRPGETVTCGGKVILTEALSKPKTSFLSNIIGKLHVNEYCDKAERIINCFFWIYTYTMLLTLFQRRPPDFKWKISWRDLILLIVLLLVSVGNIRLMFLPILLVFSNITVNNLSKFEQFVFFCSLLLIYISRYLVVIPIIYLCFLRLLRSEYASKFFYSILVIELEKERKRQFVYVMYLITKRVSGSYCPFSSDWWNKYKKHIGILTGSLAFGFCLINYIVPAGKKARDIHKESTVDMYLKRPNSEAKSTFIPCNVLSDKLDDMEEAMNAGNSYRRVPIKGTKLWNTMITTTPCAYTETPEGLSASISRNSRAIEYEYEQDGKIICTEGFLLGVKANIAVLNTHTFGRSKQGKLHVCTTGQPKIESNKLTTLISPLNRYDAGNDISFVLLEAIKFSDITKHFSDDEFSLKVYKACLSGKKTHAVLVREKTEMYNQWLGEFYLPNIWEYEYIGHKEGMCGLPLVVQKNIGSCIVGIHVGGQEKYGFSVPIWRKVVEEGCDHLLSQSFLMPLHSDGPIPSEGYTLPSSRSPVNYLRLTGIEYFGRIDVPIMMNQKSNVMLTKISREISPLMIKHFSFKPEKFFGPPMMKPGTYGGEYISPFNLALEAMTHVKGNIEPEVIKKATEELLKYIITGLKDRGVKEIAPLTARAAINGVPEDCFIKRMNASTAGGFGYPGKKSKHLPLEKDSTDRIPTEDLLSDVVKCLENYDKGITNNFYYVAQLKDEPRDIKKVKSGKTRVFYASCIPALITSRMHATPIYTFMQEHNDLFGTAIGIDMFTESDKFWRDLTEFSNLLMEGDYQDYDLKQLFLIKWAACTVVYNIAKTFGYNEIALNRLAGVLTDSLFPFIVINGDVFCVAGQQPSGKDGTAQDNSIVNILMLMCHWYSTPETKDLDFFTYVLANTFGDDVLNSVKESISEHFNNITYQKFCKDILKINYTSANKSLDIEKFIEPKDASFLKRKFVYRKDKDFWVAQLDLHSVMKCLMWHIPSRHVPREEQMRGTVTSVLWESALYLEEKEFGSFRDDLIKLFQERYECPYLDEFPSYDEIWNKVLCNDTGSLLTSDPLVCDTQGVVCFESSRRESF